MKKLRYTIEEAKQFFPVIMGKEEINRIIDKLKKDLYGTRRKLKLFNKKVHKHKPIIPFDFRKSLNYKGLSNYVATNGINYNLANNKKTDIFVYVCYNDVCNRKFLSLGKVRDTRRFCKSCKDDMRGIY